MLKIQHEWVRAVAETIDSFIINVKLWLKLLSGVLSLSAEISEIITEFNSLSTRLVK